MPEQDDELKLDPEFEKTEPTSIVEGPSAPAGGKYTAAELEAVENSRLSGLFDKEREATPEELSKLRQIGTDDELFEHDPKVVSVSIGEVLSDGELLEEANALHQVTIILRRDAHPIVRYSGLPWSGHQIHLAKGALMRGYRLYQLEMQRREKNASPDEALAKEGVQVDEH